LLKKYKSPYKPPENEFFGIEEADSLGDESFEKDTEIKE